MEVLVTPEWKDLYSAVKERKMAQMGKQAIVKKVEEQGKILAIEGKYEKPKVVLKHCYAAVKKQIRPQDVPKTRLEDYDVVIVGCPGSDIPKSGHNLLREYVLNAGGWLLTTDWVVRTIVEYIFPGYIRWNGGKTADVVVPCQIDHPEHPFLEGIQDLGSITQVWKKNIKSVKAAKGAKSSGAFSWWLEDKSFPIEVINPAAVTVLISSEEIRRRWGAAPVLLYFDVGTTGGRVIHMISHTHLQKGKAKGKLASAMILTNILDEKVAIKHGLKGKAPSYSDQYGGGPKGSIPTGYTAPTQQQQVPAGMAVWTEEDLAANQAQFTNPDPSKGFVPELTETSQVVESTEKYPPTQKCALGDGNFEGYEGKIYKCSKCGAPYHEACINWQMQEGVCKICGRILLW
ncbi:MAG: hypothetical protein ACTSU5_03810 [Promethearchaeota archaeon]